MAVFFRFVGYRLAFVQAPTQEVCSVWFILAMQISLSDCLQNDQPTTFGVAALRHAFYCLLIKKKWSSNSRMTKFP
jgi:hypothetical protein